MALADARTELDHGNLIAPAGKNAVDLALAAWELAPGAADNRTLVDDVLKALSVQEAQAITEHAGEHAIALNKKAVVLDNATIGVSAPAWESLRASITNALLARVKAESAEPSELARTQTLAKLLGVQLASAAPAGTPVPSAPQPSVSVPQDAGASTGIDPGFVKLHGPIGLYPAAAIALTEVTRQDYAAFAAATHRRASDCTGPERDAQNTQGEWNQHPGRFGGAAHGNRTARFGWKRQENNAVPSATQGPAHSWNDPGYPQTGDHPVVCVSWNDAIAYAQWLGQRKGHRYRLPSAGEWRLAIASGVGSLSAGGGTAAARSGSPNPLGLYGLDGNVAEWLADCAFGCERHQVAGRSWRGRGSEQTPGGRQADHGFDDVGFRVVQVLDARNQATQAH